MANCHKLFILFNGEGYLEISQVKLDKIEVSSENIRDTIRKHFKIHHPNYFPKFYRQGSMMMGTAIKTKDDTCDMDDGVYFKENPDNVSSTTLQKWVKDAVDGLTDATPAHRKKCITVDYKADYNVDLPVLLFNKDEDAHPKLAVKDSSFQEDDPKEFYEYFNKNTTAQMIRIIRYLKAWCDFKRNKMPSGLAMTILTLNYFQKNERDDVALKFTLIAIENALKINFTCFMPTTPNDDIFRGYDPDRKDKFLSHLAAFIVDAKLY